ncbi:histone H3-like centromeric protein A [Rhinoderma darwinii]|uniref:histone H3-like centromeric protein A n=1 Tax=Rhinoderma darwinii TaxID=43563 RepID=UPI003F67582C
MKPPQKSSSRRKSAQPQNKPAAPPQSPPTVIWDETSSLEAGLNTGAERSGLWGNKSQTEHATKTTLPPRSACADGNKYQKSTNLLIQKTLFFRLVREICLKYSRGVFYYWQSTALMALQESAEAFLVSLFEDSYHLNHQANRGTLFVKDMQLARRIRGIPYGLG